MDVIPGIELSAQKEGVEVHILGLFVEPKAEPLLALCAELLTRRHERITRICARLRSMGIDLSPRAIIESAGAGTVGRPHVARALVSRGHVRDIREAFDRYLGAGRPGYVLAHDLEPEDAVARIHAAGGLASLAHPGTIGDEALVERLGRDAGLDALEAHHPDHDDLRTARFRRIASRLGLGISGGSDFHGPGSGSQTPMGRSVLPEADFRELKERLDRRSRRKDES